MRAVDIIMKKRDGKTLNEEEIRFLVKGYVNEEIPDYQISSWLMAVFLKGMNFEETGYLTREMINSGKVFHLDGIEGTLVDKHSTGGVGDKISLILAPLAASCGVKIPMMSGRALGHTGGTLDKLDSIPGFSTSLSERDFARIIKECGFAMTGQSRDVVPADRLMYALRDVTGTVESIPLITASILSKKFAEGAESLIFDVKYGKGAFMKTAEEAEKLAVSLTETGRSLGRRVVSVLTCMDEPLGNMVGNFLEVEESMDCLNGNGPDDVMEVTYNLAAWMLVAGGITDNKDEAIVLCREKIESGKAYQCFCENVRLQGGDVDALEAMHGKTRASFRKDVISASPGYVTGIDAFETGLTGVDLGVGRNKTSDSVFPYVGIEFFKKTGDQVDAGMPLCRIYAESESAAESAVSRMKKAFSIESGSPATRSLILKEIKAL